MRHDREDIAYAIAKQVPDMQRGCTIATSYGDIEITGTEAKPLADLVRQILQDRLRPAQDKRASSWGPR